MTSRAEQLIAAPSRGERRRLHAVRAPAIQEPVRLVPAPASLGEAAGAALVLGGVVALWVSFLCAVW